MESQRTLLFVGLIFISAILYQKWVEFNRQQAAATTQTQTAAAPSSTPNQTAQQDGTNEQLPNTPNLVPSNPASTTPTDVPQQENTAKPKANLIEVNTDLVTAFINAQGGTIERLEVNKEPVSIDKPEQGFPLLVNEGFETFIAQDGLLANGHKTPNHLQTPYQFNAKSYDLGDQDAITVPIKWQADNGVVYTKTFTFKRNSYLIDVDYSIQNNSSAPWDGYLYAQFSRSQKPQKQGGFGRLPSYTGGVVYTEEEKYQKVKFKDMKKENLAAQTNSGWVAMLQHYFVGAWVPDNGGAKQFYSSVNNPDTSPTYRIGYKTLEPVHIAPNQTGNLATKIYIGSKEQSRLKKIQKENDIPGLALTVDYGFLTFIADPLFVGLSWIHKVVGNWGWSIIFLTILVKLAFYPLSAASYKSMAGMKKLQPRIQTLKDRYKDDRQKFQAEMMALYKKEKINPAGGCLPILIQIPVFIALYWVLLESVEMRHAPFALWLKDLSAPDPYYVLPVLMGLSMFLQQRLNPAPMDDIQKKVMMFMPLVLTFLFLTFPQGLVLYWVVNNVLSIAQQWWINKRFAT